MGRCSFVNLKKKEKKKKTLLTNGVKYNIAYNWLHVLICYLLDMFEKQSLYFG